MNLKTGRRVSGIQQSYVPLLVAHRSQVPVQQVDHIATGSSFIIMGVDPILTAVYFVIAILERMGLFFLEYVVTSSREGWKSGQTRCAMV